MKKEDLIEKYPDVLAEIVKDLIRKGSNKPNLLNELWNEYLEENKPKIKHDFLVLKLKNKDNGNIYFNYCNQFLNSKYEKTKIPHKYGIEKYEIVKVKYKEKEYSIGDFVMWNDLYYIINFFEIDENKLICYLENENNIIKKQIEYIILVDKNSDFKVLGLKLPHHSELWLNEKTNHFCGIDGKNVIEYEKGLLLGEVFSVKYKGTQFSIDDVVQYLDKTYTIYSFKGEQVNLKGRNSTYYYETHISNITKLKSLGVTEDGFNYFENDLVHIISLNVTNNWYYYGRSFLIVQASKKDKIFHSKDNALRFIEENNKKVLFTSFDGVEIEENQEFWILYPDNTFGKWVASCGLNSWLYETKDGRLLFSSEKSLEEYKLKHTKVLSIVDIFNTLEFDNEHQEIFLNLVKERLNQK